MRLPRILVSMLMVLLIVLQGIPAFAALPRTIISVGANMNFGTPSQPDPTNPDLYKYTNVVTKSGIQVDALVTVVETPNATLANIDDTQQYVARFNPTISTSADGYVRFRFEFIDHATNQPVWLKDFYVTSVDLDGDTSYQEFNEISGFESYTLDKTSKLTVGPGANGRTRFTGMKTTVGGIPFQDNDAFIANYTAPVSAMDVVLGVNAAVGSPRLFSINFGLAHAVGTFTTPVPYPNGESPAINVQIADGGDGYLTAVDDDLRNILISGTTSAEAGQQVTLEITGSDNKATIWETTNEADGYTAAGDLSAIPDGLITVVASTINSAGNPASAKATTTKDTTTKTTVSCVLGTTTVNSPVTCTAAVTDQRATAGSVPDGNVNWSAGSGSFDVNSCVLASGACSVTYTPASAAPGGVSITAAYQGTPVRKTSSGSASVVVNNAVTLTPASATVYVKSTRQFSVSGGVGGYTYAVHTNNSNGATINSTGLYTSGLTGDVTDTIVATDTNGTQGTATIQVMKRPTATKVTCTTAELMVGTTATCNVTVTDTSGQAAQVAVTGTVTFYNSGAGSFGSAGVCTLTNGKCSVTYTPTGTGAHTISAGYEGTLSHAVSNSLDAVGNSQSLTVDAALTIDPPTAHVPVFGAQTFTATGGVGARTFSVAEGATAAHGSVGAATGNYTGGNQAGTVVTVRVTDTQGNTALGTVTLVRRTTTASVDCAPAATDRAAPVICVATIQDTSNGTKQALSPANVAFETDNTGTFGATTCSGTTTLTCTVAYTPTAGGSDHTVTVRYGQTAVHEASDGTTALTVYAGMALSAPPGAVYVKGAKPFTATGGDGTYTYSVTADQSGGAIVDGSGLYMAGLTGGVTDTVKVTDRRGKQATATVQVVKRPTSLAVSCTPDTLVIGAMTTCTVTVTDTSGDTAKLAADGKVTSSSSGAGSIGPATTCTLTGGACSFTFKATTDGTHTVSAAYAGSDSHLASDSSDPGGHSQSLTVSKRGISMAVACDPDPLALGLAATCTVTATDTTDPTEVPSGSVSWTTNGSGTVGADRCSLGANGQCTVIYTPTVAGDTVHTVSATIAESTSRSGATASDSLTVRAASLTGTVKTAAADAVAGVTLFLVDGNGQTRTSTSTNETGAYTFAGLPGGSYTVKVRSETTPLAQATANVPGGSAATLDIVLQATAHLTLTANPAKIVGDGKQISTITAMLTADGVAVSGVEVAFHATDGTLLEVDAKSGPDGAARAKLRVPLIQGVNEIVQEASVKVHDVRRGLFAFATIAITLAPTAVDGVVMDNGEPRMPIAGAKVRIHKTFTDGPTFDGAAVTDSEGRYSIIVPRGNTTYQVEITAEVAVGGVKKEISTIQTATLGDLSGSGEAIPATKTVSGQLFAPDKQGGISGIDVTLISGQQVAGILRRKPDGAVLPNPVVIAANGAFQVGDVPIGSYDVVFQVQAPDGQRLAGAVVPVTVANNGELTIGAALVDPFGIVIDAETTRPIGDVRLDLLWADTPLNVGKGRKPNTRVELPLLPDFKPNQNRVTQNTTGDGEYGFMVFPDGDYFIVALKAGYQPHESPVIHVGETIVEYNFAMRKAAPTPSVPASPAGAGIPAAPEVTRVRGTVVDTLLGRPVSGARVNIREDFDGDGVLDVDAGVHTAADGSYELAVPQRSRTYTAQVATTLPVQGKARQFTVTQRIVVPDNAASTDRVTARNTIAGQLYFVTADGGEATALTPAQARALQATVQTTGGTPINKPVTISETGDYQVDDLALGTYRILFQSPGTDGRLVPVAAVTVPINQDGQLSLQTTVIDPFATVRDGATNAPIPDALVSLFWADTPPNRENGHTPGTLVTLPEIGPFVADNNANPQLSNGSGRYGWLCLAQGDYYFIARKDGYLPYDSRNDTRALTLGSGSLLQNGILHVETMGCNYDIVLQPMKIEVLDRHTRYVRGYPDGNFNPENAVTRAEVAAIFARLMKVELSGVTPAVMTDLQATDWASRHIAVVMRAGLFTGYPDGSFGPDKPITRAELAAVIARFKGLPQGKRGVFQDTAGYWAEPYITATFEAGIVLGFSDNTFAPTLTTRRAELVAMINRMLGRGQLMTGRTQPRWPDVPFSHWAVRHIEEASITHTSRLGEEQKEILVEEFADTVE